VLAPSFPVAADKKGPSAVPPPPSNPFVTPGAPTASEPQAPVAGGLLTPPPPRAGEAPLPPGPEKKEPLALTPPPLNPLAPTGPVSPGGVPDAAPERKEAPAPIIIGAPPKASEPIIAAPRQDPPLGSNLPLVTTAPRETPTAPAQQPSAPPIGVPLHQLPTMPAVKSPAREPARADAGRLPEVKSYTTNVRADVCQPGDTSFAALSQRFYGTDQYAAALQAFNREHLHAHPALKQDPPQLQPGVPVFAPPTSLLGQMYPSLAQANTSRSALPPVRISAPTPLVQAAGSSSGTGVRINASQTADATRSYRVPAQGQMILEIAQQTLRDANRWPEIYRLNPNVQPQFPIPGGTEIRLPVSSAER
jgi:hypothetical protein